MRPSIGRNFVVALVALGLALAVAPVAAAGAATLSGTVQGQQPGGEAKPLPEVKVTVLEDPGGGFVASAGTDAAGKYAVEVPPGVYEVRFDPPSPYESTTIHAVEVTESRTLSVMLTSSEAVHLTGTLRDHSGEPVPGVQLTLNSNFAFAQTQTAADGSYSLAVPPGQYELVAHSDKETLPTLPAHWFFETVQFELGSDQSRDVTLPSTSKLTIEALGKEDVPLPEAQVSIPDLNGSASLGELEGLYVQSRNLQATTGKDGRASFVVFDGGTPLSGEPSVTPPQNSGYGRTAFEVPKIEGDTTVVVRFVGGEEEESEDAKAPEINELGVEPGSIDTSSSSQIVTVRAHILDDLSGFASGEVRFSSPSGKQTASSSTFKRYGGNANEGDYEIAVPFEKGSETGLWSLSTIRLKDVAGNERVLNAAQIEELSPSHTVFVQGGNGAPTVTLESSPNPSVHGQAVTFTAKVVRPDPESPSPLGTIAFVEGTNIVEVVNLTSKGTATFKTQLLGAGKHPVVARYSGDANYGAADSPVVTQVVERAKTQLTVSSTLNPAPYGSTASLKATVEVVAPASGTPAGTITFSEGSTVLETVQLSGKTVSYSLKSAGPGTHAITATYSGDPNNLPSKAEPFSQTIAKASTMVALTSTLNPAPFGSSVTLTAKVKPVAPGGGTPAGTVTFREGSTVLATAPLSNGAAKYPLEALLPGSHEITATYSGEANYEPSESSLVQTISKASTELSLTSSKNPAPAGTSASLKATVKPVAPGGGTPTGTVTFSEGSTELATVPLENRIAKYPLKGLAIGTHEITASYAGSAEYEPSKASIVQQITP